MKELRPVTAQTSINRILDLLNGEGTGFMCDIKKANQWRLNHETNKVKNVLRHMKPKNVTQANNLIEAT